MTFNPSPYQQGIFDFIEQGQGNGIVNAVAGSGKTTTLVQSAKRIRSQRAIFLAFNKHIAEALAGRLVGTSMQAKTIHGIGYGCLSRQLGKLQVNDQKYRVLARAFTDQAHPQLIQSYRKRMIEWSEQKPSGDDAMEHLRWTEEQPIEPPNIAEFTSITNQLLNLCRLTLTDPASHEQLVDLMQHHSLALEPATRDVLFGGLIDIISEGIRIAEHDNIIDYSDMLYLPYRWDLRPIPMDWVFTDECQDLSAAQLDLVLKCQSRNGRLLFVGDPFQSIMGFAGADNRSFWNIQERTGAHQLPLSICYRCPEQHISFARSIVPQIEARPDAPAGEVIWLSHDEVAEHVQEGDLIVCRTTAPLISLCIRLILQRVPARVRGRDIGKSLTDVLQQLSQMSGFTYAELPTYLDLYQKEQAKKLSRANNESALQALHDRCESILACYQAFNCTSVPALSGEVQALFSDDRPGLTLSTIHRSKGDEARRVTILNYDRLPLYWPAQQPWQAQQERNLHYVALTRAMDTLTLVNAPERQ